MAKDDDIIVVVSYPFKEYSYEVDQFIRESFELYGIGESGSGTDFKRRDVDGHCSDISQITALQEYLKCFPFDFKVEFDDSDRNTCGLCGEILDEDGFHEDGTCPEYDED